MTSTVLRLKIADVVFFIGGTILMIVASAVPSAPFFLKGIALLCFVLPPGIHIAIRLGGFEEKIAVWHKYVIAALGILLIFRFVSFR